MLIQEFVHEGVPIFLILNANALLKCKAVSILFVDSEENKVWLSLMQRFMVVLPFYINYLKDYKAKQIYPMFPTVEI